MELSVLGLQFQSQKVVIQGLRHEGLEHIVSACLENSRLEEIYIFFGQSLPTDEKQENAFKHKMFKLCIESFDQ